ncbi:NADH dehydrogenase [ubiquinone] 1 beta subcomplex subunit 3 [Ischnura elegans]|uniref:NADH dehydrogenase [ubiquinone] 1 beta subcomplex subunit 3 n=1 Tax=Ischnura elegans TaxID=197161 RepID=UPI001ED88EDC|nr:NADH dehydrogenase [ubiquinone] 1 beta subcomplex subunit 3 [Ischnura elegans]
MGGGHHGHGHKPYVVPDYKEFKVEEVPELAEVQDALKRRGLKDPWLRNEVWRYSVKEFGTPRSRGNAFFFRGFKWGLGAFVATVAIEKALEKFSPAHDGHGHGHH